ncbi:hypothetical protein RHGRI_002291 [Rhododendron griersonianum]|uniref:BED-type domain-containing protein n=1 Tax=Rhododendron griersonianum TaxID=479676 RepID=A0AAV6LPL1_9ERIC|nr:hypothetical protein RHGRI_002291 [Rhododendron griersonianum]
MSSGPSMTSDHASSHAPSMTSAPAKSDDPAWAYGKLVLGKKNNLICLFCNKHLKGGGITRLKQHLAGVKGEVEACKNVQMDVKWQMNQMLEGYKQEKERRERISKAVGEGASYQALEEEEEESLLDKGTSGDTSGTQRKRSKTIGSFFAPRTTPGAQPSIKSALSSKQTIDEARMAVARWWYDANIPFNATLSPYYQPAIDAMVAVGPGFKGPSYHDLRCPLLNNNVREIREYLLELRDVTRYIYNHAWVLNTMRKDFTNGRDLCRPGITRFATNFLSLQCLLNFKKELRQMFTSDKWLGSRYAKCNVGKEVAKILLEDREFWSNCQLVVKVSEPLVRVLRLTDGDEKPVMGYLYEAMDKAKEAIKVRFNNRLSLYGPYTRVIDARWDRQLHSHLHAAGCFLNPAVYFKPSFKKKKEVDRGMIQALTVLVPDEHLQDQISAQIEEYKQATGDFNMPLAFRQREKLSPVSWWGQFGGLVPELQRFAIRVLSQCCSATGCERNWSTFEFIHSKKRNRLEHKRLNDLVYVRYNLKLRERIIRRTRDALDPISLENIDVLDDWVSEEPGLLDEEDIAWENVEPPSLEALTLDEDVQEPNFDDAADDFPNENESQYDYWDIGGHNDPYVYVE